MANAYIEHIAINSSKDASIFSNELTWKIFEFLRSAGKDGLTENQITDEFIKEKITVPSSSQIYSILKRLYEMEWVHRDWDKKVGARRHVLAYHWGGFQINEDFYEVIIKKMDPIFQEKLFPILLELCNESYEIISNDKKNKHWLPSKSNVCTICEESHEAIEFFSSVLQTLIFEFEQSDMFSKLLKDKKFAM